MQQQWYYGRNGQRSGPVDEAALRQLAGSGQLSGGDLVWCEGMVDWQPAGAALPALFPPGATTAAPVTSAGQPWSAGTPTSPGGPVVLGYDSPVYSGLQYVGFWWRVLSYLIDYIITYIASLIIGIPVALFASNTVRDANVAEGIAALSSSLVALVLTWLYFALMESSKQQATLGKMAIGVRVTDLQGQPIGFGRATGRFFSKILSGLILAIGFIMVAFTEKKQGLHDMIAGTLVVKGRPRL